MLPTEVRGGGTRGPVHLKCVQMVVQGVTKVTAVARNMKLGI